MSNNGQSNPSNYATSGNQTATIVQLEDINTKLQTSLDNQDTIIADLDSIATDGIEATYPQTRTDNTGALIVAQPFTLFDSKQVADTQPLFWNDVQASGSGTSSTYNTGRASTSISVSASTVGKRVRQTYRWFNYQPGKTQRIILTDVVGTAVGQLAKRWGYFNGTDGLYFELAGGVLSVNVISSVPGATTPLSVTQANFNGDKLDGTGASGVTLDLTKFNIFIIDFIWLGGGPVHFGVLINGQIIYAHTFTFANSLASVFMSNPNLPVRYEIENKGTGGASSLECICSTVQSLGGFEINGIARTVSRGTTALTTNNDSNLYPLVSIRLKTTHFSNTIYPASLSFICNSTADFYWAIVLNPTIATGSLTFVDVTNSAIQADVTTTNATTITGGTILYEGYGQQGTNSGSAPSIVVPSELTLGSSVAGTADIVCLAFRRLSGTTETFYASLSYREIG